jgi:DNA-binding beta-propeller fold protein YncE
MCRQRQRFSGDDALSGKRPSVPVAWARRRLSRLGRVFWVAAAACLTFVAAGSWTVTRAIHLLSGPSVILPGDGFSAVAVSPDGRTLYAANGGPVLGIGHTVTPVDIATGKPGRPITVGTGPQDLAVTPDGRMLYALLSDGRITPVDLAAGTARIPIHVTGGASVMTVSPDSRTLYIATGNNEIVAVDTATGRRDSTIPLGTPASGDVGPNAMTVSPDGTTLYVADSDDTVIPVSLATRTPGNPVTVGNPDLTMPMALAVSPDGKTVYAAVNGDYGFGSGPNTLVAISTATGTVSKTITYGQGPIALTIAPDGRTLYVLNGNYGDFVTDESTVTPVRTADGTPRKPIRTAGLFSHASAFSFAITPDSRTAYVSQGDVVAIPLTRLPVSAQLDGGRKAIPSATPGCGALLRSREPLNSTVESTTRRQNGQIDGVMRSSMPARACLPGRSSITTCSTASTGSPATQ